MAHDGALRQGEPLRAVATLESLPEERITSECLSLGTEADAPGADAPLLKTATLQLNDARNAVEIRTETPVTSPALELFLRVQCPGALLYARHFAVLVPPATTVISETNSGTGVHQRYRLKVAPGETLTSLAAAVAPGNPKLQKQLVQEVLAENPKVFPSGKPGRIPAGTVLWFPDLRSVTAKPAEPVTSTSPKTPLPVKPTPAAVAVAATPAEPASGATPSKLRKSRAVVTPPPTATAEPAAAEPVKLRRALALGEKPGAQECKTLMPLCGVLEAAGPAPVPAQFEQRAVGIESGVQALKLKQDGIDTQLARLEQSLQDLRKVIESRPEPVPAAPEIVAPAPPPPKPEIRTVVKTEYRTEPIPWFFWLGIALAALAAAAGGFFFGRKRGFSESLVDSDNRLDEMLASAADEMRDLDRAPQIPRNGIVTPPRTVRDSGITDVNGGNGKNGVHLEAPPPKPEARDIDFEKTQVMNVATNVDLTLDSGPKPAPIGESVPGVTSDLAFEMDQALDNTRSMFTDVDRFIALGRTQNALSLLQFQVVKDPKDRDSWIKLLAIYRQEKMDADLDKALRDFRRHFPNDKDAV